MTFVDMSQRTWKKLITIDVTLAWRDCWDGKIREKIRYRILLHPKPGREGHSQRIVRCTRPYSLLTRLCQRVAFPLRERRPFMSRPIQYWFPFHVLGKPLSDFLEQFPFASADVIARHFAISKPTIKDIIDGELGLRRFSRRWLPHSLRESPKADRVGMASDLSTLLRRQVHFFLK
jgi:hypothetical protein